MEVVGYSRYDFEDSKTGKNISGYTLYLLDSDADNVMGRKAVKVSASFERLNGYVPELGDLVDVVYNEYGKVKRINFIKRTVA